VHARGGGLPVRSVRLPVDRGCTLTTTATWSRTTTSALGLGVVHALVDAASGFLIFRDLNPWDFEQKMLVGLVVLYNCLAFGGQTLVGLVADRTGAYRAVGVLGALLAAIALLVSPHAVVAGIVIVGIGNALFHVGAGALVLRASGDRATESGVFVGPGAIGLATGILIGTTQLEARGVIVALLVLAAPFMTVSARAISRVRSQLAVPRAGLLVLGIVCASCLLGSVTVRSLVGGTIAGSWRGVSTEVLAALAVAACAGKMLGGFVSDRYGWIPTSVLALLLSTPLIVFAVDTAAGAIVGMLLFQMTMPVTLKAMHHVLPQRPGLAFGIPCAALVVGALPGLLGYADWMGSWVAVLSLLLLSAAMIVGGLGLLERVGVSCGPLRRARSPRASLSRSVPS